MSYLHEKCDLDVSWMERLQQIRYDISQQKNLFDAAFCAVKGLVNAGFDQIAVWTYNAGDDVASSLLGVDEHGKIYSNPQEFLSSDSIPPIYGYSIEIDKAIIKEKLGIDDTTVFLQKDKDENIFADIWGYPPPYPGYYKRDARGDNICLRTSEEHGKILIMSVDNFISERIIDNISANFIHLVLVEMEKVLIDMSLKEAIIQSESKNKAILDAIPDLMFRITKDGVFTDYKD
ncbi:MAG: Response regulator, partial [Candidatus Poribacteria bacterium]|nr:Response regulator [Candidatus Poribacteria bacterium]